VTKVQTRGEEGVSDVAQSRFLYSIKKLVSQLFSAFCEAHESSEKQCTGIGV